MLQQLSYELATLTPMAWVDIFRRRFTLRQQLQEDFFNWPQAAVRADSLAFLVDQIASNTIGMSHSFSPRQSANLALLCFLWWHFSSLARH